MDPAELRQLLNEGIAATRRGDHAAGRELLLRVVAADETMEPAWLWLATALEDPADQLMALENVLALNPRRPQALAGAAALRAKLGVPPAPPPPAPAGQVALGITPAPHATTAAEEAWQPSDPRAALVTEIIPPRASSVDISNFEDDPYQCAYCGQPTEPEDERCPHCGRDLLMPGFWKGGSYQYWLLILVGLLMQASVLQVVGALLQALSPQTLAVIPGVDTLVATPVGPAAVRLGGWIIVLMLLLQDNRRAYHLTVAAALLDGFWLAAAAILEVLALPLVIGNASLAGIIGLLAVAALVSQAQARLRRRVVLARGMQSAPQMHDQAEAYAKLGMWALAALHWRRAIGKDPRNLAYYKGLGRAQIALKQYAAAVKTFRSGVELAPNDKDFPRLIEAVRAQTRNS